MNKSQNNQDLSLKQYKEIINKPEKLDTFLDSLSNDLSNSLSNLMPEIPEALAIESDIIENPPKIDLSKLVGSITYKKPKQKQPKPAPTPEPVIEPIQEPEKTEPVSPSFESYTPTFTEKPKQGTIINEPATTKLPKQIKIETPIPEKKSVITPDTIKPTITKPKTKKAAPAKPKVKKDKEKIKIKSSDDIEDKFKKRQKKLEDILNKDKGNISSSSV
jgi:hypothetical protein